MSQHSHVYHSPRWRKARQTFLQRHPLCVYCQQIGQVTAASVVDHIKPHRLGQALQSANGQAIQTAQRPVKRLRRTRQPPFWTLELNRLFRPQRQNQARQSTRNRA